MPVECNTFKICSAKPLWKIVMKKETTTVHFNMTTVVVYFTVKKDHYFG